MDVESLKELQKSIIKKNKRFNLIIVVTLISVIGLSVYIMLLKKAGVFLLPFVSIGEFIIIFAILSIVKMASTRKDVETFNKEYKNIFVLKELKDIFKDLEYKPEKGFSEEDVDKIGILDTGDSFESNDYISGKYKGIKFEQSDLFIQEMVEEEDTDGETDEVWRTIFLGSLMVFDFNKNFKSNIQVFSRGFDAISFSTGEKYTNIKMEDSDFNNKFFVFAQNEHEAFYILTPNFMEKIKEITKKLNSSVMYAFVDNKLYIAVDNYKDAFEWDVLKPIDEQKIKENINKDIKVITDFVDELNLNNDLFKTK